MGRSIRECRPGDFNFVTHRCFESRLFLTPDEAGEVNQLVLEALAVALARYTGIDVVALVVLANHIHALIHDKTGDQSAFWGLFASRLARTMNARLKRASYFFDRRHSSEPILDAGALRDRLAYLLANPVAARQVDQFAHWPGVLLFGEHGPETITVVSERRGKKVERSFTIPAFDDAHAAFAPRLGPGSDDGAMPLPDGLTPTAHALELTKERCKRAREEQPWCAGKKRIFRQRPKKKPKKSKRSPRPPCHTSCKALRAAFLELRACLREAYAAASACFRAGALTTAFPPHTFRPPGQTIYGPAGPP